MSRSLIASAMAVLLLSCAASKLKAEDLRPFSPQDKARVDELLKSFDPNSYDFHYQHLDASGKVQSAHVGMANLTQSNTVRGPGSAGASTNTIINIFKPASTNTTINIFKQASTNTTINIFKDARRQASARELNAILQRYSGPASAIRETPIRESAVRESPERISEGAASKVAIQGQGGMRPLSAQDKARVDELLRAFDPNSYDFLYQHLDTSGRVQAAHVGMANLTQSNTVRGPGSAGASTNTIINIFKPASTNTTINIFKQASTNTTINIFKDAHQQANAQELNAILQRYVQ
jgi:hypothetical protein